MITKKHILLVMYLVTFFALTSCEYRWIEGADPTTPVSLNSDVQPIFDNKCISCHKVNGMASFSLESDHAYESIISEELVDVNNAEASILLTTEHAASAYSELEEQTILIWIQQGAKDN